MRLITINDNVLANPEMISCVEQKTTRGIEVTYVWVEGRSYLLEVPLNEFYKSIEEPAKIVQNFAG